MRLLTSHLVDDSRPLTTLCGAAWEDWQEPNIPTNDEIGFDSLSYGVKVELRRSDEARMAKQGDLVSQCPACVKAAYRMEAAS